jgi:hypothetical protein
MLDMFRKMDKGNKGEVDFETLQMALKDMAGADLNPGEAQQVMTARLLTFSCFWRECVCAHG